MMSPTRLTIPEANISFSDSMSLVSRVMSRPTGVAIEEPRPHPQHVPVEPHAQVVHPTLPNELRQIDLRVPSAVLTGQGQQIKQPEAIEPGQTAHRDVFVDGLLEEIRLRDLQQRHHGQQRQRDRQLRPVGPDVAEDSAEQGPIERLAEELVVLRGALARAHAAPPDSASAASCSRYSDA